MNASKTLKDIWPRIRPLLLPYEGAASQVCVLDLPEQELERILAEFCQRSQHAEISCLDSYTFEDEKRPACNPANFQQVLRAESYSIVKGTFHGDRPVWFWIWPDRENETFTAEFVFFAEDIFDLSASDDRHMAEFEFIYALAEMARENNIECECAVSASETGCPTEQRREGWTFFW